MGEGNAMITRGCRNEFPLSVFIEVEGEELVKYPSNLERTGNLDVFKFKIDISPPHTAQGVRIFQRGLPYVISYPTLGLLDLPYNIEHLCTRKGKYKNE